MELIALLITVQILSVIAWIGTAIYAVHVILSNRHTDTQPIIKPVKPKNKAPTAEEIKYQKILANIDSYDGSGKGQVKI